MSTYSRRAAAVIVCLVAGLSLAVARPAHAQLFEPGTFQNLLVSANRVVAGDVNGDGKADALVLGFDATQWRINVYVSGASAFTLAGTVDIPGNGGQPVLTVADVDADGHADLIIGADRLLYVFWGDGTGAFTTSAALAGFFGIQGLAVADLNRDSRPDIVVAQPNAGFSVAMVEGLGARSFAGPRQMLIDGVVDVAIGDADGDGQVDLFTLALGGQLGVLKNQGGFNFLPTPAVAVAGFFGTLVVADLNGDGRADAIASTDAAVSTAVANADGTLALAGTYNVQVLFPDKVTVADLDGDGVADLLAGTNDAVHAALLIGRGDGTLAAPAFFAPTPFGSQSLQFRSLATGDVNGDGEVDIIAGDTALARALHVAPLRITAGATAGPTAADGTAAVTAAATVTSSHTGVSFAWSEGTSSLGSGATITTRLGGGDHALTVRATSPAGLHAIATTTVSIAGATASQVSVNLLQQTLDAKLDAAVSSRASEASVTQVNNAVSQVNTAVSQANTSLSQVNTRLTSIEGRMSTLATQAAVASIGTAVQLKLDVPVSSRAASTDVAAVGTKVDQLKASLPSTAALDAVSQAVAALGASMAAGQLRLAIEGALAHAEMIASFYLPTANGGQLDLVHSITEDVVNKSEAAGGNALNVARGRKLLSDGNARKALGDYRGAYLLYVGAYQVLGVMTK